MPSEVLDGRELGDVIDELARARVRGTRGAWGVLTLDLIACQTLFDRQFSRRSRPSITLRSAKRLTIDLVSSKECV